MIDFTKYPICDTDVWVNICIGKVAHQVFDKYDKLLFADTVEIEILKWHTDKKFSFIATDFDTYKENGSIFVIDHLVHLTGEERQILQTTLYELGFSHGFHIAQKNKGEFASAVYADHFGCTFMATNDHAFQPGGKGAQDFSGLEIKNWNEVISDIGVADGERIKLNRHVESERKRMDKQHQESAQQRILDEKIKAFAAMHKKR
jgi:hypothetical protein